ncbi:GNAT family N-acetyltransferase [Streptococcus ovis]|uniref:GNAT family N-acetyltransferase n=1 Tax=Streptococcus ovis TaxID=82806 RepID=UPI00038248AB|nr:GNAT family N-acetyltransferase [Streptococcus ovis]
MTESSTFVSKKIQPLTPVYWKVKKLYEHSFPAVERLPYFWMTSTAMLNRADFFAYYLDGIFCGFTFSLSSKEVYYPIFLAVVPEMQSQGCGGKILSAIAKKAGERPSYVTIEPLDFTADNALQRKKRLSFYEKNGYYLTAYRYHENQEIYHVMTTQPDKPIHYFEKIAKRVEASGVKIKISQ